MGDKRFVDICMKGTLEEVREALANGADVNERDGTYRGFNKTGLMYAVGADHELLVSLLLHQPGVLVNVQDDDGCTALYYATRYATRRVVQMLLNFPGIDTEITDRFGRNPLERAAKSGNQDFVEEYRKKLDNLEEYQKKMDKIFVDACMGHQGKMEDIRNILANGVDVNGKKESTGTTILMEAVRRKRGGLVSLLLEQPDIQVNAKNKDNWTALHFVVQAQHSTKHSTKKMIQSMLNFPGINTEIANDRGETPLMMATRVNNEYFVKVYLKKMGEGKKITQKSWTRSTRTS